MLDIRNGKVRAKATVKAAMKSTRSLTWFVFDAPLFGLKQWPHWPSKNNLSDLPLIIIICSLYTVPFSTYNNYSHSGNNYSNYSNKQQTTLYRVGQKSRPI